jgi:hypothetical protein
LEIFLGRGSMCTDGEAFTRYAKAEKELCERAGTVLAKIIDEIESRYGFKIAELRVTMDRIHSANGWPAANCVMVREEEVEAAPVTKINALGASARRYTLTDGSQEAMPYVCKRYRMAWASSPGNYLAT